MENIQADHLRRIAFIGNYLPRRCGIATFTADLAESVATASASSQVWAVAMNDRPDGYRYPHRVKFEVNDARPADYRLAAEFLNSSQVDVVCLQHEYGIFGGADGNRILSLVRRLRMPVVTTLHTVLREPTDGQRRTLSELADLSQRIVVMAHKAVDFLGEHYDVPEDKIELIPHGIPDIPFMDPNYYREQFGIEGKKVILTFGLLAPSKGIESMLDAMPRVVGEHPEAVYIVLGATHPHVQKTFGEEYRTGLLQRAARLGVAENVIFQNRFVDIKELCEFLSAADVYVTPYVSEAQIVSGTLAYALGAGNAVVSTPYWHAQELLADGRGILVPFQDSDALAREVIDLFHNDSRRHAMRKQAYQHTRSFVWSQVALRYARLFSQVTSGRRRGDLAAGIATVSTRNPELPEIKLDHLRALTDDTGVLQHAKGDVPDLRYGYTTNDAARALVAVLTARDHLPSGSGCSMLIRRYLSFLNFAFDRDRGRFRNTLGYDRRWQDEELSQEAHGHALWALGETVARTERPGEAMLALQLFHEALPAVEDLAEPRGWAYSLIGMHAYLRRYGGDTQIKRAREAIAGRLMEMWEGESQEQWPWPEPQLTYANARLPHALLLAGRWTFNDRMVETALRSLEWLDSVQTAPEGHFSPVGCDGWFVRGQTKSRFDQQPLEAAAMIDACLEAHYVTNEARWLERALRIFNWHMGDNDLRIPLYDPTTGGCFDGLHAQGVSENQGAESAISWLLSLTALYEHGLANHHEPEVVSSKRSGEAATMVGQEAGAGA